MSLRTFEGVQNGARGSGIVRVAGRDVIVIGGSLAGLFAAAAAASSGARTTIIERDVLPNEPSSRKGVPQDRQPHVLLHRGLLAAEELLPGLREDLIRHGAVRFGHRSHAVAR